MAVNKPYGDNARKGAVRERSQVQGLIIRYKDGIFAFGLFTQEGSVF